MRRYALCYLTGEGTFDHPLRAQVAEYFQTYASVVGLEYATNPSKHWVFALVAAPEQRFAALDESAPLEVLSFGPEHLNVAWTQFENRSRDRASILAFTGVDIPLDDDRTIREIVEDLVTIIEPLFDINSLNVQDVT